MGSVLARKLPNLVTEGSVLVADDVSRCVVVDATLFTRVQRGRGIDVLHGAKDLINEVGGHNASDLRVVVRRGHLDHVRANDVEILK